MTTNTQVEYTPEELRDAAWAIGFFASLRMIRQSTAVKTRKALDRLAKKEAKERMEKRK